MPAHDRWQRDIDPLIPQIRHIAHVCDRLARQTSNVEVMPLNGDDVARRAALDEIGADTGIGSNIGAEQIREEA